MSGYVYGFGFGLFIAYTSALLGSIACFYLCRRWFKVQVRAMVAKKPNLKSVVRAVEKRGFRLMLLIRLSPYPFNIMNALFSATHIPLSSYIIATALSLTKLALHVYIGSTLSSLAVISPTPGTGTGENGEEGGTGEGTQDPAESHPVDRHSRTVKIVVMSISMILGIAVGIYVWRVAKREIEASEGIRNERRRKRRESLRQSRRLSNMQGEGRGSGRAQQHVVARTGSANSMVQSGLGQECVADIDMSALGGSHSTTPHSQRNPYHSNDDDHSSNYVGGAYPDEDEFGHEDQALVNNGSGGGYASDSEESDIPDDDDLFDDDDVSDMERGADDDMGSSQAFLAGHHPQQLQHHRRSASWQSHQDLTDLGPRSHRDNTNKGWFSQNGVDVNGRGW
ncbi:Transmembrane protein 64 [Lunasporangiospora selenospora]|uniref:Golgi apparatus membrane protein TVP38 n=1 Tax=Lunasporangiospora selenospora TaxID=979761 RepID=A0A9P6FZS5_9FUNG|nr:Transmembrane protein 64 [Lunasporangiospora selenospora]